jgi:glycosyltransferase involved in cell wall biosynthesis
MIAHYFPPGAGSGIVRTVKFVRYLPGCGWEPVVLTMSEENYVAGRYDETIGRQLPPELEVHRTDVISPLRSLAGLKRILLGIAGRRTSPKPVDALTVANPWVARSRRNSLVDNLRDWLAFPDNYGGWFLPAVVRGYRLLRRQEFDVIYSTSPSPVVHMIAYALKRLSGLPWLADNRDPWECLFPEAVYYRENLRKQRAEIAMAERCVRGADLNVLNTEAANRTYRERFPDMAPDRFRTLPNGFDPDDFADVPRRTAPGAQLSFLHAGTFFPQLRTPDEFLAAMDSLIACGQIDPARVCVKFIGCGEISQTRMYLQSLPRIPHRESVESMGATDVLLLLQQSDKYRMMVPAKAYEYMAMGKWLLTITPTGATRDLVGGLPNGRVVSPDDSEGLKSVILELYNRHRNGSLYPVPNDPEVSSRFNRQQQTKVLAGLLNELAAARHAGGSSREPNSARSASPDGSTGRPDNR